MAFVLELLRFLILLFFVVILIWLLLVFVGEEIRLRWWSLLSWNGIIAIGASACRIAHWHSNCLLEGLELFLGSFRLINRSFFALAIRVEPAGLPRR